MKEKETNLGPVTLAVCNMFSHFEAEISVLDLS